MTVLASRKLETPDAGHDARSQATGCDRPRGAYRCRLRAREPDELPSGALPARARQGRRPPERQLAQAFAGGPSRSEQRLPSVPGRVQQPGRDVAEKRPVPVSIREEDREAGGDAVQIAAHPCRLDAAGTAAAKVRLDNPKLLLARLLGYVATQTLAAHLRAARTAADLLEGIERPRVGALDDLAVCAATEAGVAAQDLLGREIELMALEEKSPVAVGKGRDRLASDGDRLPLLGNFPRPAQRRVGTLARLPERDDPQDPAVAAFVDQLLPARLLQEGDRLRCSEAFARWVELAHDPLERRGEDVLGFLLAAPRPAQLV